MKKSLFFFCVAVLFMACDNSMKEARQFAEELSAAIAAGDTTTLSRIFPDAVKADSLVLTYTADSLKVEEHGDTLHILFSKDVSLDVVKNAEGKLLVTSSYGIFAYPADKMSMALATGWITKDLNDTQIAERFTDSLFVNSIADNLMAGLKTKLKATCNVESFDWNAGTTYAIIVTNNNDFDIPADAYRLILMESYFDTELEESVISESKSLDGVMVKAKSSEKCPVPGKYDPEYGSINVALKINYTKDQAVKNLFHPTGNEYAEYLSSKTLM